MRLSRMVRTRSRQPSCLSPTVASHPRSQCQKQVILGDRGVDHRPCELKIFRGPGLLLDLHGDSEPPAVLVDLRPVGLQCVVPGREVVPRRGPKWSPCLGLLVDPPTRRAISGRATPCRPPTSPRARQQTLLVKPQLVVQPSVSAMANRRLGKPSLRGRLKGRHRDVVALDVIGVGVSAVLVVSRDDMGTKRPDEANERLGGRLRLHPSKAPIGNASTWSMV